MVVALIPARGGSARVPDKNIRPLGGIPLLVWTIKAARKSELFDDIVVSSDSEEIGKIAELYEARWIERPAKYATATSTDFEWIAHALGGLPTAEDFMLLRPTNPFRRAATIKEAWQVWMENQPADSLRSVRPVREHPYKMWREPSFKASNRIYPVISLDDSYDSPTQRLPEIFVQSGCIQIFTRGLVDGYGTQTGMDVIPFFTPEDDAFDINTEEDWEKAERMAKRIKPEGI